MERIDQIPKRNDAITAHLKETHYPMIILAGSYAQYFDDNIKLKDSVHHTEEEIFRAGLIKALEIAHQSSDQVVLINDVPHLD